MEQPRGRVWRWLPLLLAVLVLGLVAAGSFVFIRGQQAASPALAAAGEARTVVIDPGHGGPDGGAVGTNGNAEKDINLAISLKLRSFFEAGGFHVVMTREDDRSIYDEGSDTLREKKTTDIHNRLKIAQKYPHALFLSIHQNLYAESQYSGAQVFYSKNNPDAKLLAQSLQTTIRTLLQPQNDREVKEAGSNLYILYHATTPAVLVECGFVSNPEENAKLQTDAYQNQMAFSIYTGTLAYYAQKAQTGSAAPQSGEGT